MPAPIISTATSVLGFSMYEQVIWQPVATNTPTSWTCPNLPPGLTINGTTGRITGAATAPGYFNCLLKATNGDGSGTLEIHIGIEYADFNAEEGIEVDFDLASGSIVFPSGVPVAKRGDDLPLLVGLKKNGVLLDLPVTSLEFGLKQYEPEALLVLSDGNFVKIGSYESTRWKIIPVLTPEDLDNALSDNEADTGTAFVALCEIQVKIQQTNEAFTQTELRRSSQTFGIYVARDQVAS